MELLYIAMRLEEYRKAYGYRDYSVIEPKLNEMIRGLKNGKPAQKKVTDTYFPPKAYDEKSELPSISFAEFAYML